MFGSQFLNHQTSWEEIKDVLAVMESGRWTSVYTYNHFVPPSNRTDAVAESVRIVRDEKEAERIRQGNAWTMIGPPRYVIDRCGAFIDAGVDEFCLMSVRQNAQVYAELDEEIFSAFG